VAAERIAFRAVKETFEGREPAGRTDHPRFRDDAGCAAFQGMGSIFMLTFGGPGNETMVLSLAIWQEAYANLHA